MNWKEWILLWIMIGVFFYGLHGFANNIKEVMGVSVNKNTSTCSLEEFPCCVFEGICHP